MVDPDKQVVILDHGSDRMKIGFAGDDAPRAVFPTIVGRPRNPGIMVGMDSRDVFVGDEAISKRGILRLKRPINQGLVTHWNDMEKIWHHCYYNELSVSPEEHPVILTEPASHPKSSREKMAEIKFETFNVPALLLAKQPVLNLFSVGEVTGCQADIGDTHATIAPVFGGIVMNHIVNRLSFGGRDVTEYLIKILSERGYEMTTSAEREIVKDIKEKTCYVCKDLEYELNELERSSRCEHEYELPDGSKMTIGSERFRAPEILFKPSFIGSEEEGLSDLIFRSICTNQENEDSKKKSLLLSKIVVTGGSSCFYGILDRLKEDTEKLMDYYKITHYRKKKDQLKISCPSRREFASFIGASIVHNMEMFRKKWISKDEYDEYGASVVNNREAY